MITPKGSRINPFSTVAVEMVREPAKELVLLSYEQDAELHEIIYRMKDDACVQPSWERRTAIFGRDIKSLNWIEKSELTDAIISRYLLLIEIRSREEGRIRVTTQEVFFLSELPKPMEIIKRRSIREGKCIFNFRYMMIPELLNGHYRLFIIDISKKQILCLNSMRSMNRTEIATYDLLVTYMQQQATIWQRHQEKWEFIRPEVPQQLNGRDCGAFICAFAELYSRGVPLHFTQKDVSHVRRKIAHEVIQNNLLS